MIITKKEHNIYKGKQFLYKKTAARSNFIVKNIGHLSQPNSTLIYNCNNNEDNLAYLWADS